MVYPRNQDVARRCGSWEIVVNVRGCAGKRRLQPEFTGQGPPTREHVTSFAQSPKTHFHYYICATVIAMTSNSLQHIFGSLSHRRDLPKSNLWQPLATSPNVLYWPLVTRDSHLHDNSNCSCLSDTDLYGNVLLLAPDICTCRPMLGSII
jgi:hypothetical protein